jgi:hypothetical protein
LPKKQIKIGKIVIPPSKPDVSEQIGKMNVALILENAKLKSELNTKIDALGKGLTSLLLK